MLAEPFNEYHPDFALVETHIEDIALHMCSRLQGKGLPANLKRILENLYLVLEGERSSFNVAVIGPCLVGYNLYTPWWSKDSFFTEEFIYRYKDGAFSDTVNGVEELARRAGCKAVCIGTLAMTREVAYCALLSRKGYRQVAQQLIKEL